VSMTATKEAIEDQIQNGNEVKSEQEQEQELAQVGTNKMEVHNTSQSGQSEEEEALTIVFDEPDVPTDGDGGTFSPNEHKLGERQLVWFTNIMRALIPFVAVGAVTYLAYLMADSDNWSTDEDSDDDVKLAREKARGTFVSVMMSIMLNLIGAFMFHIGVREGLVITNYGFILGPVIGFILDQGIGSDEGFQHFMTWTGFQYALSCLIGGNFMRYIITVFLDLFISNPLQDVLKRQAKRAGVIEALKSNEDKKKSERLAQYDHFVALNFPSILQSMVAVLTYNAYTNQTRFAWAYPAYSLDRDYRIPPGTIMLATASSGVMYLVFYTLMDTLSDRGYYAVNTKLGYVMAVLFVLYGLNETDSIEAPVEGEDDNVVTESIEDLKPLLGLLVLIMFILYGFVYPVWTRLGCSCLGKYGESCKPSKEMMDEQDHIIYQTAEPQISDNLALAFLRKLNESKKNMVKKVRNSNRGKGLLEAVDEDDKQK